VRIEHRLHLGTFTPPEMTRSSRRPSSQTVPSSSTRPRSPTVTRSPRQAAAVFSAARQYSKRAHRGTAHHNWPRSSVSSRRPGRARPTLPGWASQSSVEQTVNWASVDP
jgi:hypothetical protein